MSCKDTPQFNEYSSLNSLLMSSLYSENSRDLIIKNAKTWDNSNKYKSLIKKIVNKNKQKKDISSEISSLKPEDFFFDNMFFLKDIENQKKFITNLKKNQNIKYIRWTDNFIIDIYRSLGLSCLDIYYFNQNFYLNLYKFIFWSPQNSGKYILELNTKTSPTKHKEIENISTNNYDVLVIFHNDFNKTINNYINAFIIKDNKGKEQNFSNIFENKNEELKKFIEIKEEIDFNGNKYILDSVLLKKDDKSIVGFRCDGEKYVYNNFASSFDNPCSIIKYDWNYNNGEFCHNPFKCDLNDDDITNIDDLCFNFNEGNKTLIYIKKDVKPVIPDITDEEILQIIKEIKAMDLNNLSTYIKTYDTNIISQKLKREELEKIALRFKIINYSNQNIEKPQEPEPDETEQPEE